MVKYTIDDDKTIEATITQAEIDAAVTQYDGHLEALEELERAIGTFESYGAFPVVKPNYAKESENV